MIWFSKTSNDKNDFRGPIILKTRCFCKPIRFCTILKIFFFIIASTTFRKMWNFFCRYLIKIAEKSNKIKSRQKPNQIKSNHHESAWSGVSNQIMIWFLPIPVMGITIFSYRGRFSFEIGFSCFVLFFRGGGGAKNSQFFHVFSRWNRFDPQIIRDVF